MKVRPTTVATAGTFVATVGAGIAKSSIPYGAAIGGAMTSAGTSSLVGGHVIAAATPVIAVAAPFVLAAAGGAAIGYAVYKCLEDQDDESVIDDEDDEDWDDEDWDDEDWDDEDEDDEDWDDEDWDDEDEDDEDWDD